MRSIFIIGSLFVTLLLTSSASAQFGQQQRISGIRGQYSARSTATATLSRPTVSPYLAIADINGLGVDTSQNYFTQVRPRMERERTQQRQQMQVQQMQQSMANLRSQGARQNQQQGRITGHPTRFGYYLHYYPNLNRR